ncbi:MAG: hypothetical protein R6U96_06420, partial [Promethearchaeia archaeon]
GWLWTTANNGTDGYFNITVNPGAINSAGLIDVQLMANKSFYDNKTDTYNFYLVRETQFTIIAPAEGISKRTDDTLFNITVYYEDLNLDEGINGNISYNIDGQGWLWTTANNGTDGYFNITVNPSAIDSAGQIDVQLMANKSFYDNKTDTYSFYLVRETQFTIIEPEEDINNRTDDAPFNITVYYEDLHLEEGIDGNISYNIDGQGWLWTTATNGTDGYFNITVNPGAIDSAGPIDVQLMVNKSFYDNKTDTYNFYLERVTELIIDEQTPAQYQDWLSTERFNITLFYNDTVLDQGIEEAEILHDVNGTGYESTNYKDVGGGYYNLTVYNWQVRTVGYGHIQITINTSLQYYINRSVKYNYYLYNATQQSIDPSVLTVVRGNNATFTGEYMWNESSPISGATVEVTSIDEKFIHSWNDNDDGTYDLVLNTSKVVGNGSTPYSITFEIYSQWNQTQVYDVQLYIWNRTDYAIKGLNQSVYGHTIQSEPWNIYYGEDVTFNLSYFDTDNGDELISGAWSNLTIYNETDSWSPVVITTDTDGYYISTLNTESLYAGTYDVDVALNATYYNTTVDTFSLTILECNTSVNMVNLTQYEQNVKLNGTAFEAFKGKNLTVYMNYQNYYTDEKLAGAAGNLSFYNGYDTEYYIADESGGIYSWEVNTSKLAVGDGYSFNVTFEKENYQANTTTWRFDINIIHTNVTIDQVYDDTGELSESYENGYRYYTTTGVSNVTVRVTYWDVNHSYVIGNAGGNLNVTLGDDLIEELDNSTDANGQAWFELNSTGYDEPEYTVNITFAKPNYYSSHSGFNLSIVDYQTNASILAVNQTGGKTSVQYSETDDYWLVYRNYDTIFLAEYINTNTTEGIEEANARFEIPDLSISISNTTGPDGNCSFLVPTHNMTTGTHGFTIRFSKDNHENSEISGSLKVVYIPTNGSLEDVVQLDHETKQPKTLEKEETNTTYFGYLGYNTTVTFSYWDKLNKKWISEGANCSLLFDEEYYYNASTVTNGNYSWTIPTFNKEGTFVIEINMSKFNWANVTHKFNLTIRARPTDLSLEQVFPDETGEYESDDVFNITVYFNDTIPNEGLTNASITALINGKEYSAKRHDYNNGYYNITVNCSDNDFWGYGPFTIDILINKTFYVNQSVEYEFDITALSKLSLDGPKQTEYFANESFTIILNFSNPFNGSRFIPNADLEWRVGEDGTYADQGVSFNSMSKKYEIELSCHSDYFKGYGPFNVSIKLNKTYYYNKTTQFSLNITGLSESQIKSPSQETNYNSDQFLTIKLGFNNSVNNSVILEAQIQWKVGPSGEFTDDNVTFNEATDLYVINVSLQEPEFDGYGDFTIYIELNQTYYENQTEHLSISVTGLTAAQIDSPEDDHPYDSNETISIEFSYNDSVKGLTLDDTDTEIEWKIGGKEQIYTSNWTFNSSGLGNYKIELEAHNLTLFNDYGQFTLYFNISKANYEEQCLNLNFTITGMTSLQLQEGPEDTEFFSNETVHLVFTYNDSERGVPITGANVGWKVTPGEEYNETGVTKNAQNYTIDLKLSWKQFESEGFGPFTIYLSFNKSWYYNKTTEYELNVTGLTEYNILNLTQYQDILLDFNSTAELYEAQPLDNITINMNFNSSYPSKIIKNATGNLAFQGKDHNISDTDGLFQWEINASQLPEGNYSVTIRLNKTWYEGQSFTVKFRISRFISKWNITGIPDKVIQGGSFEVTVGLYYERDINEVISHANVSLSAAFGAKISEQTEETNQTGDAVFSVNVPEDASEITLTFRYAGNESFTPISQEITSIELELLPEEEDEEEPPPEEGPDFLIFLIMGIVIGAAAIFGIVLIKARGKKEEMVEEEGKKKAATPQEVKKGKVSSDEAGKNAQKKKDLKVKTVVIEQEEEEKKKTPLTPKKGAKGKGIESVPKNVRDYVESTILKILYKEKSVKSKAVMIEKVLEASAEDKKTISEKTVKLVMDQMRKEKKIQFTQKEGWKIQI